MLIYSSNTALYYPPIMTGVFIAINVAVMALTATAAPGTVEQYQLWYGEGIHPIQWVTSPFMHADSSHLIGNLLFLWPFGLVVEGKLGWWKFTILYLAIAFGECALEQCLMLGFDASVAAATHLDTLLSLPELADISATEKQELSALLAASATGHHASVGASSVIFGLLCVAVLFAPASDYMVWMRFTTIEVPVVVVGGFYIGWEAYLWYSGGYSIGSALLHLLGVVVGLIVGLMFLRWGSPECDDLDLINHTFGKSFASPTGLNLKIPTSTFKTKSNHEKLKLKAQKNSKTKQAATKSQVSLAKRSTQAAIGIKHEPDPELAWLEEDNKIEPGRPPETLASRFDSHLTRSQYADAAKVLQKITTTTELQRIPLTSYVKLYRKVASEKHWSAAAFVLKRSLTAHPANSDARRLQLAKILLLALQRADKAREVLRTIGVDRLDPQGHELFKKLTKSSRV